MTTRTTLRNPAPTRPGTTERGLRADESPTLAATEIAHDLKNLLAAIAGSIELAQDHPIDAPQCIRTAAQATNRARDLVQYLMRLQQAERCIERVDLEALLRETVAFVTTGPHPPLVQLDLDSVPAEVLDGVLGETRQLQRAVLNLVVNACDAVEERAAQAPAVHYVPTLRIALETDEIDDRPAVAIVIADNGAGVPPELRERIFEPFVTAKRDRDGAGLGLAIVDAIVRDHHGRIDLDSVPGEGTTFRLVLPANGNAA